MDLNKQATVRVAPNISATAGHYGHFLVMVVGALVAKSLNGRLIVRVDWSFKTRGSLHADASDAERQSRNTGFARIRRLAEYCGASELIDEYGTRHSLDGVNRARQYRVLPEPGVRMPIVYYYDEDTLTESGYERFLADFKGSYCRTNAAESPVLPLIAEQTHPRLSECAAQLGETLLSMCHTTGEPARRFVKAYCHLEMDRLLGVTHVIRGSDFHSNRIRDIHEREIRQQLNLKLPTLCRVPVLTFRGEKISSSEEDGVQGIYPRSQRDVEDLLKGVIASTYVGKVVPTLDTHWFAGLLSSRDPLLDAPLWQSDPLELQSHLVTATSLPK